MNDDDDADEYRLFVHETPEGIPPRLETRADFELALSELEPGKLLILLQAELPDLGDDEAPEGYLFCKIMRDGPVEDSPPPFWIIGLDEDQDLVEATARKLITEALGGKVTGSGFMQ